ncbi:sugar phosphate isomerase/epimerase family protein [Amycolatopsis sp. WGS_07]|uniref:sugar phosphate isomerase/epimerase family protein n=1 Tax=Amycolatopsis sp. WGS_07 TaxID=3076764 RepID=UPI003873C974
MRLALSTLGLPGQPLIDVLRLASDHGWHGLELRCAPGEAVHVGMSAAQRRAAARACAASGLTPLAVAGYTGVAAPGPDEPILATLRDELRLAADLGAPHLRVFPRGGNTPDADTRAVCRLRSVADEAQALGVRILLETHDSHARGTDAARVVRAVGRPEVGVLWDVLHTVRSGESPAQSFAALAPHLGYLQVKDVASLTDLTPIALGAGVLPLKESLDLMPDQSWAVWEYEAAWHPTAAPLPGLLAAGAKYLTGSIRSAPCPPSRLPAN